MVAVVVEEVALFSCYKGTCNMDGCKEGPLYRHHRSCLPPPPQDSFCFPFLDQRDVPVDSRCTLDVDE